MPIEQGQKLLNPQPFSENPQFGDKQGGKGNGDKLAGENFSQGLLGETKPVRDLLIKQSLDFLGGDFDVSNLPQFQGLKQTTESQYGRARENILANTPTGGALTGALANLEGSRAANLAQGISDIGSRQLDRAYSLAIGAPLQAGIAQQGQAAAIQAQNAAAQAQRDSAAKTAVGIGIGGLLGGGK